MQHKRASWDSSRATAAVQACALTGNYLELLASLAPCRGRMHAAIVLLLGLTSLTVCNARREGCLGQHAKQLSQVDLLRIPFAILPADVCCIP